MPTNPITKRNVFLAEPYQHIDPAVTIQNGGASTRHFRVIGVTKSDWGNNLIYFDIFDLNGQIIHPSMVAWNWLENADKAPKPAEGDKPFNQEPSGNIGMINGVHVWLEAWDFPSERAIFPPPDGSSWYVVFQMVDVSEPTPEPGPAPDPPPTGQPPAMPFNLQVASTTDTTITLRWAMPNTDPSAWAERFKVSWSTDMSTWQNLTTQIMQATVPDLLPDTLYLFRVQAINQYGESPPAEIPGTTASAPPVEPPNPEPSPLPDDPVGLVTIHYGINDQLAVGHNSPILKQVDPTRSHLKLTISKEQLVALLDYCNRQGLDKAELAVNLVHPIR